MRQTGDDVTGPVPNNKREGLHGVPLLHSFIVGFIEVPITVGILLSTVFLAPTVLLVFDERCRIAVLRGVTLRRV